MIQFECSICEDNCAFDPKNSQTYLQVEETGNSFVGELLEYRVGHNTDGEQHINVIVTDINNNYRAHKDAYVETIESRIEIDASYQELLKTIPIEIKYLFNLASNATRQYLLNLEAKDEEKLTIKGIYKFLKDDVPSNNSPALNVIYNKCALILGKDKLSLDKPNEQDWYLPNYLRIKARADIDPSYKEQLEDFSPNNAILKAEKALAMAEISLRLSEFDILDDLYNQFLSWKDDAEVFKKQTFYTISAYYGYGKYLQGELDTGIELVEPAFHFSQLIVNKELVIIAGNFLGAITKNFGDLEKATRIYKLVRDTSETIGDKRSLIMISNNLGGVLAQKGALNQALEVYQDVRSRALEEDHSIFSLVSIVNISETLQQLGKIDEAIEVIKEGMETPDLPEQYRIPIYTTFLQCIRTKEEPSLLDYFERHYDDKGLSETINGKVLQLDIDATRAELSSNYSETIKYLDKQRELVQEHHQTEKLSDIEMRMAEIYFTKYSQTQQQEDLDHCYHHLDLIGALATENGYHPLLYQVTYLKAMVAAEANSYFRVENLLDDAQQIVEEHNLSIYEDEITAAIEQLHSGELLSQDELGTRQLFSQLQKSPDRSVEREKQTQIYAVIIYSNDLTWEQKIITNKLDTKQANYLQGVLDVWRYTKSGLGQMRSTTIRGEGGTLLLEFGEEFHILLFVSAESYRLRTVQQEILDKLSTYELRHIVPERDEYVKQLVNNKLNV